MANYITISRLLLLFIYVAWVYQLNSFWQLAGIPLLITVFILDGLDGYVARLRQEESIFGAILDIAVDRIVENVLWLVLVDFNLVPVWVAIVFITRGFLVDAVRSQAARRALSPFGMMQSNLGRFLVASRFMRGIYGSIKAVTFSYLFTLRCLKSQAPIFYTDWSETLNIFGQIGVFTTMVFCLLRGLPVLTDFGIRKR